MYPWMTRFIDGVFIYEMGDTVPQDPPPVMRKVGVVMRFGPRVNFSEGNLQGLPYQLGKVL